MSTLGFSPSKTSGPTKLSNRGYGAARVLLEIERGRRESDYRFSILMVRFEGLGRATERLGYASEDSVWQRVLGVLTEDLAAEDLCCRLAGDEFMLILSGKTSAAAARVMERIQRRWRSLSSMRAADLEVSVGMASYPSEGSTVEGLFAAADESRFAAMNWNQPAVSTPPTAITLSIATSAASSLHN